MASTFVFVGMPEIGSELAPNLLEAGFKAAEDIASADCVFTFTPFMEDTEEVYFGTEGLVSCAKEGACLVNLSAATPTLTHEISALAQVSNMHAIDAPLFVHDISREHPFVDKTNVSMFVGSDESDLVLVRPLLEAMSSDIVVCGGTGTGQVTKAAATLQRSAALVGLVEADSFVRVSEGADAASALIARSLSTAAASPDLVSYYSSLVARQLTSTYSADVMLGEVVAALIAADDIEMILPQAESAEYLLQMLCTIGGVGKSTTALSLMYSDEAECARYGLDWEKAEAAFPSADEHDHEHHHHHHFDDDDDFDDYDFGYSDFSPN